MKIKINQIEQNIYNFLKTKRLRIYFFLALSLFLLMAPSIPYANVLIDLKLSVLLIILIFILLFSISLVGIYLFICLLFLLCAVLVLLSQLERAEDLANYIFSIVVLQVLLFIFNPHGKKIKK